MSEQNITASLKAPIIGWAFMGLLGIGTLSLPSESGSHNEMHNLVYGRISDEKDKSAVYAGI